MRVRLIVPAVALAASVLAACVSAQSDLSPGFGQSLRGNVAAQVADPDARYRRDAPPGASGTRTAGAQDRYNRGEVTPLSTAGASEIGTAAGASDGGAGAKK